MNQFILIINGPICSGKTSAVGAIMSTSKKVFNLSQNKIKGNNPVLDSGSLSPEEIAQKIMLLV